MKNIKNFNELNELNEGSQNSYQTSEEISGYDNAIVLYLSNNKNIPNKVKWIRSVAEQANCDAQFVTDNMVLVISKNSEGDSGELKKFVKLFELK